MKCVDPCLTRTVTVKGRTYLLNDKNYLRQFSDWDEQLRDWLAASENLTLREEHLYVVGLLRSLFAESKKHPVVRMVTHRTGSAVWRRPRHHETFSHPLPRRPAPGLPHRRSADAGQLLLRVILFRPFPTLPTA